MLHSQTNTRRSLRRTLCRAPGSTARPLGPYWSGSTAALLAASARSHVPKMVLCMSSLRKERPPTPSLRAAAAGPCRRRAQRPLLRAALCAVERQPLEPHHGIDDDEALLGEQPVAALAHLSKQPSRWGVRGGGVDGGQKGGVGWGQRGESGGGSACLLELVPLRLDDQPALLEDRGRVHEV